MNTILLKPIIATETVMNMLEKRGLIFRMAPKPSALMAEQNCSTFRTVYNSDEQYGPHRLIEVCVNSADLMTLNFHSDNEEFIIVGEENAKPLYLLIGLSPYEQMQKKIANKKLSQDDFILLEMRHNDIHTCIFTMRQGVVHTEATNSANGRPPTFFVTESRDIDTTKVDLQGFSLELENESSHN